MLVATGISLWIGHAAFGLIFLVSFALLVLLWVTAAPKR
jgi:hypothetical protein